MDKGKIWTAPPGINKNLFFWEHHHPEQPSSVGRSVMNTKEAELVVKMCLFLLKEGINPEAITMLATYP